MSASGPSGPLVLITVGAGYRHIESFSGLLNFKRFLGMPDIPEFVLVNSRCWVQEN